LLATCQAQTALAQEGANGLITEAIAAERGAATLSTVKRLAIKGDARFCDAQHSDPTGGDRRFRSGARAKTSWEPRQAMARTQRDRDQKYPDAPVKLNDAETVLPTFGYVTDEKGSRAISGIRAAAHLRELKRASPWLLMKAMDTPKSAAAMGDQKLGNQ